MPSLRRRGNPQHSPPPHEILTESEEEYISPAASDNEQEAGLPASQAHEHDLLSDEEGDAPSLPSDAPLSPSHTSIVPPNLREISTLASWTVSSSKPGCSIPQLRHPSPNLFWQSDGPQPHYLNIHFFKLVRIVGLRLYLDFDQDESYTPTRIVLLAGSGMNDLVEWGEMRLETPRGWVWADFSGVGDPDDSSEESDDDDEDMHGVGIPGTSGPRARAESRDDIPIAIDDSSDHENTAPRPRRTEPMQLDPRAFETPPQQQSQAQQQLNPNVTPVNLASQATPSLPRPHPRAPFASLSPNAPPQRATPQRKKPKMPVLRCHLVQIKILENHQNGKDTHLRGLQIFAHDGEKEGAGMERSVRVTQEKGEKEVRRVVGRRREREYRGLGGAWDEDAVLR